MKSFMRFLAAEMAMAVALLAGCTFSARHAALTEPELPTRWLAASGTAHAASASTPAEWGAASAPLGTSPPSLRSPAEPSAAPWWRTFADVKLNAVIEEALARNADLAIAAIRVRRAQLEARLADAETAPRAELTGSANAERVHTSARVNGTVSFELDLWGKLAARRDEAIWRAQASEADREAAASALIATTAKLYWRIGYANESIVLGKGAIADALRTVALVDVRVAAGAASPLDAAQARQQLARARAEQAQRWRAREVQRNALALLLGGPPETRGHEPANLSVAFIPQVPARLPALVLARRPDLRAAERRLRAQLARVDFARASIYPSITLTGELGTRSDVLMRTLQNPLGSIGAALALPFVQWNTVRLQAALSEHEFDEVSLEFRKQLYRALADVEDALAAKTQLDAEWLEHEQAFADAALAAALARTRFERGATDVAPLLDAQRAARAAELDRTKNQLARLENRIDLFVALGGD
ncbi:efflux transporter outer membrane subunit [Trinickia acidisoli]|uniref:efflux transporter outer membrane subunit n=1 Tax=Trinickia acidisoli TaxID=2767482 RepID=UPI001A907030|nr:efflux transporter outer membrane subunit [Trinickia acidisoli]